MNILLIGMITIKVKSDPNFERKLRRAMENAAIKGAKEKARSRVTPQEFSKLRFKMDWNASVVNITGPDEIVTKLNLKS